ncbi:MAG: FG-GAP-like repeat-containing protein, partial [Gammaproteobacteria bacterium]
NRLVDVTKEHVITALTTAIGTSVGSVGGSAIPGLGTLLGAAIGAAVGFAVGKAIEWLKAWWGDDIFAPYTVSVEIPSINARWAGSLDSGEGVITFKGHNGTYQLTYDWGLLMDSVADGVPVKGSGPEVYDGDGKTDFAVWRPREGNWYIIKSSDGTQQVQQWGTEGDIPVPGDYDGDGKTDFAVWRPREGNWYIIKSSDGTHQVQQWGVEGDIPVVRGG